MSAIRLRLNVFQFVKEQPGVGNSFDLNGFLIVFLRPRKIQYGGQKLFPIVANSKFSSRWNSSTVMAWISN